MPEALDHFVRRLRSHRIRRPREGWFDYDGKLHPRPKYDEWDDPDRSNYNDAHLTGRTASCDIGWTDVHEHTMVSLPPEVDPTGAYVYWQMCTTCMCHFSTCKNIGPCLLREMP